MLSAQAVVTSQQCVAQVFELWEVPRGEPLVRVLYNKEELPLDGHPHGMGAALSLRAHLLARQRVSYHLRSLFCSICTPLGLFHIQPDHRLDSVFVHVGLSRLSIPVCAPFSVSL